MPTNFVMAMAWILAGYLCGAIPFGLLIGKAKGVDVRTQGSGNIGATNVGRVIGRNYGLLVFALDLLKGLVPVVLARQWWLAKMNEAPWALVGSNNVLSSIILCWMLIAAACILGHMFPVYLKFKGGKGVATALGVLLGIYPYFTVPALIAFGLWILVTGITRYVSLGSVVAATAFPIIFAIAANSRSETWGTIQQLWPMCVFSIVVAALIVYRHRSNLQRLLAGTESKIGASRNTTG